MEETALAALLLKVQDNITTSVGKNIDRAEQGITRELGELKQQVADQDLRLQEHTRADLQAFADLRTEITKTRTIVEERTAGGLLRLHLTAKQKTALWTLATSGAMVLLEFLRQATVYLSGKGPAHP
jgi:hypothetical protein